MVSDVIIFDHAIRLRWLGALLLLLPGPGGRWPKNNQDFLRRSHRRCRREKREESRDLTIPTEKNEKCYFKHKCTQTLGPKNDWSPAWPFNKALIRLASKARN